MSTYTYFLMYITTISWFLKFKHMSLVLICPQNYKILGSGLYSQPSVCEFCDHRVNQPGLSSFQFSCSVLSDPATPWTAAYQAFLSITNSQSLLKLMSIESVMPSSHPSVHHTQIPPVLGPLSHLIHLHFMLFPALHSWLLPRIQISVPLACHLKSVLNSHWKD